MAWHCAMMALWVAPDDALHIAAVIRLQTSEDAPAAVASATQQPGSLSQALQSAAPPAPPWALLAPPAPVAPAAPPLPAPPLVPPDPVPLVPPLPVPLAPPAPAHLGTLVWMQFSNAVQLDIAVQLLIAVSIAPLLLQDLLTIVVHIDTHSDIVRPAAASPWHVVFLVQAWLQIAAGSDELDPPHPCRAPTTNPATKKLPIRDIVLLDMRSGSLG